MREVPTSPLDDALAEHAETFSIGLVGLASPVQGVRKDRVEEAIDMLRTHGFSVAVGKTAFGERGYKTASADERADDLQDMFANPDVDLIMNLTGGYSSNDLLERIDYDMIAKNPKWFVGYSDITALCLAFHARARLHTVSGAMFVDYAFDRACFHRLFDDLRAGTSSFEQAGALWECPWEERADATRMPGPITRLPNKCEAAEGLAIAGNLSTFNLLLGTPYMPCMFDGVYFLEYDKEEAHALPAIERMLQQLRLSGMFARTRGLVFGSLEAAVQKEENDTDNLLRILQEKTDGYKFPVLTNATFGHNNPSWTIINGQKVGIRGTSIVGIESVATSLIS